mmetsp:Transcript_64203/g.102235  ORF Transcript_64203/g.102235 Transcript_64203/m.102235 type:complete len:82 (+) Transcript_64203:417-662(+)
MTMKQRKRRNLVMGFFFERINLQRTRHRVVITKTVEMFMPRIMDERVLNVSQFEESLYECEWHWEYGRLSVMAGEYCTWSK